MPMEKNIKFAASNEVASCLGELCVHGLQRLALMQNVRVVIGCPHPPILISGGEKESWNAQPRKEIRVTFWEN